MTASFSYRTLICALLLAALSTPAMAQVGVVMQIQPEKGGFFPAEGGRTNNGIPLRAWTYSAEIPADADKGEPIGARRYAPVSFEKPLGAASPQILRAMLSGEPLTITVDLLGLDRNGAIVLLHRVIFGQARILSIARKATGDAERASAPPQTFETVTFNFRRVEFDPGSGSGWVVDEVAVQ
jgi:type VI secretion system Hcp family effector